MCMIRWKCFVIFLVHIKNVSENLRKFRIVRRDLPHQILNTKPPYSKQYGIGKPAYKISANKHVGVGVGVKKKRKD